MGNSPSMENVALAQATVNTGEIHHKLNAMGVIVIILMFIVICAAIYDIRLQCHRRMKNGLRREVANVSPPVLRVQTVQQRSSAGPAGASAGYV